MFRSVPDDKQEHLTDVPVRPDLLSTAVADLIICHHILFCCGEGNISIIVIIIIMLECQNYLPDR